MLLVWKLDRFGRSIVDCLNNIKLLEDNGIRFIAVTQGLDTVILNPASRFLLHVLPRFCCENRTQNRRDRFCSG